MFAKKMFILVILIMVSSVSFVNAECNDDCLWYKFLELYDAEKVTVTGDYAQEKYLTFLNKSDYKAFTKDQIQRLAKILKDHLEGGDRVETIEINYRNGNLSIREFDVDVKTPQKTIAANNKNESVDEDEDEGLDDATRVKNYCIKYIAKLQRLNTLAFDPYSSTTMNAYVNAEWYFSLTYDKKHLLGACLSETNESVKNVYLFAAGYSPGPESLLLECRIEDKDIVHYQ
jgi:hypothetical protein